MSELIGASEARDHLGARCDQQQGGYGGAYRIQRDVDAICRHGINNHRQIGVYHADRVFDDNAGEECCADKGDAEDGNIGGYGGAKNTVDELPHRHVGDRLQLCRIGKVGGSKNDADHKHGESDYDDAEGLSYYIRFVHAGACLLSLELKSASAYKVNNYEAVFGYACFFKGDIIYFCLTISCGYA